MHVQIDAKESMLFSSYIYVVVNVSLLLKPALLSNVCFSLFWLQQNAQRALENLQGMTEAFLGRLVPSESLVIKTTELAVALKKVSADDVKGLNMEEGYTKFQLPGNLGNLGDGSVNAKVRTLFELCASCLIIRSTRNCSKASAWQLFA